jgi:hypothetical protein
MEFIIVHGMYIGVGYLVGCFTPAVCRKIKALFVSETQTALKDLKSRLDSLESKVVTAAK